jgi:hypothetical protein
MGVFEGMWQDDGDGCAWSTVPAFDGRWVTDITAHPTDPMIAFAITSNGGPEAMNGLVRRDASGQWSDLGTRENLIISRLAIASTPEGLRFYQSVLRGQTMPDDGGIPQPIYEIRVSDDEGASWEAYPFEGAGNASLRLEAVDPSDPDRIVVTIDRGDAPDSVLVSSDRGQTFEDLLMVTDLGGIALAPDGRIWIGEATSISNSEASKGLWFAPSLDAAPTKLADYGVECLGYQPANETLYVCQGFSFGTADESGAFTQIFRLTETKDFVACEGVDMAATCQAQLCRDYCAAGHFSQAPLCCAYDDPQCGPSVAESEGTGSRAMCEGTVGGGSPDAGLAGSGGAGGSVSGGAGSAGSTPDAGTTPAAAGTTGPKGGSSGGGDGGGCGVLTRSKHASSHLALGVGIVLAAALRHRRRRRVEHGWSRAPRLS